MTRFRTRLPDQECDRQATCPPPNFEGGASSRTPAGACVPGKAKRRPGFNFSLLLEEFEEIVDERR